MPRALAIGDGSRTGLAAGFSGVGVNSHRTTGFGWDIGAAEAVAVNVVPSRVAAITAANVRFMGTR
ncbi:hypothetical protein GCM10029976_081510 [Kribbella albertanoniae]